MGMDLPTSSDKPYVIQYNDYASGENVRRSPTLPFISALFSRSVARPICVPDAALAREVAGPAGSEESVGCCASGKQSGGPAF